MQADQSSFPAGPAEDDPEDANEVDAPAPLAPVDAFDWM